MPALGTCAMSSADACRRTAAIESRARHAAAALARAAVVRLVSLALAARRPRRSPRSSDRRRGSAGVVGGGARSWPGSPCRFIEQPARRAVVAGSPIGLARAGGDRGERGTAASWRTTHARGGATRYAADQRAFAAARVDRMDHTCWATTSRTPTGPCEFGDRTSSTTLALLGDSHAEHWLGALDRAGQRAGVEDRRDGEGWMSRGRHAGARRTRASKRFYHECTRYREAMLRRIIAMRPAAVILSSWDHYLPRDGKSPTWQVTPAMWERGLRRTYARLPAAGIQDDRHSRNCRARGSTSRRVCRGKRRATAVRAILPYDRERSLSPRRHRRAEPRGARATSGVRRHERPDLPDAPRCPVVKNGTVVFTDDNHLTASFSRSVGSILGARLAVARP